jgi:hypothetical protein
MFLHDVDIYHLFGHCVYEYLSLTSFSFPDITGDLEIFKYVLGKYYLENI